MPLNFALILFELVVLLFAISLHDCAQAWAADRLGDPTPRLAGRLTMNPVVHFDLIGTLMWPLLALFVLHSPLVFGWGKPMPMVYRNFRRKDGEMLATLAGPVAQVLCAVVALVLLIVLKHTVPGAAESMQAVVLLTMMHANLSLVGAPAILPVLLLLDTAIMVNLLLAIFNLLPVPFLDGGKILLHFLPYNAAKTFQQYSMWIMVAFFFFAGYVILPIFLPLFSFSQSLLQRL